MNLLRCLSWSMQAEWHCTRLCQSHCKDLWIQFCGIQSIIRHTDVVNRVTHTQKRIDLIPRISCVKRLGEHDHVEIVISNSKKAYSLVALLDVADCMHVIPNTGHLCFVCW